MDRERIERLAIDSAAGQLNEDAEALLKEYLAEHSEESNWFSDMQEIYKKTQAAFHAKTDFAKEQAESKIPQKFSMFPVIRWAAVIVISVCIGATAGRWSKSELTQPKPGQTVSSTFSTKGNETSLEDFLDNFGDGFWRDKITALLNPSPVKIYKEKSSVPSLMEQYRQYLKERNYE
ncbi:MAG: hypothetical protein P8016_16810 [Sedimentisphaerales bacterium]